MALIKKDEAEKAVRYFCTKWAQARRLPHQPDDPDFSDFYSWMQQNSPGHLRFRTTTSVRDDVERWFISEFKQGWRY